MTPDPSLNNDVPRSPLGVSAPVDVPLPVAALGSEILSALEQLDWLRSGYSERIEDIADIDAHACLLRALLNPKSSLQLADSAIDTVRALITSGYSLQFFPKNSTLLHQWIGSRLCFFHESILKNGQSLLSIASSRIGRNGSHFRQWPKWVESALRVCREEGSLLLRVSGTTLSDQIAQFAQCLNISVCTVDLPSKGESLSGWLARCLSDQSDRSDHLFISPEFTDPSLNVVADEFHSIPLRDRVAFVLADQIRVLSVRPNGALERLIRERVANTLVFPAGTTRIAMPREDLPLSTSAAKKQKALIGDLLDLGAVGWIESHTPFTDQPTIGCHRKMAVAVKQLSAPMPIDWNITNTEEWDYLCHCTRGNAGALPDERPNVQARRLLLNGSIDSPHPLLTLDRILMFKIVMGQCSMTRTNESIVSFSAVPLPKLLSRRKYRAHLGRWDWEPYGLMIRRQALEELGARPVIYGDEEAYEQLHSSDRALFQPTSSGGDSWEMEQEWRLSGDLWLNDLPPDSVKVFVRNQQQATHFSDLYPWPVIWAERN